MDTRPRSLVLTELRDHAPFTALGALSGIVLMLAFTLAKLPQGLSVVFFEVMHPAHVVLSAIVTTAMYWRYKRRPVRAILVGYIGALSIGTLSDVLLPHLGGLLIGVPMGHLHVGFIEEWWIVNPAALFGVAIGMLSVRTRIPHLGHVLLSTWASLFYLTAFGGAENWLPLIPLIFVILFVTVWLPCCLSDILFPLLFVGRKAAAQAAKEHGH